MSEATLDTSALSELDGLDPEAESVEADVTETPEASADDPGEAGPADDAAADGPARDERGRFVGKADGSAEAPVAEAETIEAAPAAEQQPEWKPYTLKVKGQESALEGVSMTTQDGHVLLATPEAQFNRVRDLLQRGRLYEEREQEFIARERSLREKESAPRAPSAEEIEAKVVLEYLKPHLANILSDADLQWLQDKVKLANLEAQSKVQQQTQEFTAKQQEESQLGQFRESQLAVWMNDLAESADFAGKLTKQELEEFFDDLKPYAETFLQVVKPNAPMTERFGFREAQLRAEFEKRVRRAGLARNTAAKVADATRFNNAQKPAAAAAPAKRAVTNVPKAAAPTTKPAGRKAFDNAFKDWGKRPGLDMGDDDE